MISLRKYAELQGVSYSAVYARYKRGCLDHETLKKNGKIYVEDIRIGSVICYVEEGVDVDILKVLKEKGRKINLKINNGLENKFEQICEDIVEKGWSEMYMPSNWLNKEAIKIINKLLKKNGQKIKTY